MLDTLAAQPVAEMLPNWGGWDYIYASDINENDDVLGSYQDADGAEYAFVVNLGDLESPQVLAAPKVNGEKPYLNNPVGGRPAQVAGRLDDGNLTVFRWSVGVGLETFPASGVNNPLGMNDAGTICGGTVADPRYAALLNAGSSTPQLLKGVPPSTYARELNNAGDVLIDQWTPGVTANSLWLYRSDWNAYGNYVNIVNLLSQQDRGAWLNAVNMGFAAMTDRGSENAGHISGWISPDGSYARGFFLTPIAP